MAEKLELPPLPSDDADADARVAWVNRAVKRTRNMLVRVEKHGNVAPLLVLVFANGDELTLTAPMYTGTSLQDVFTDYDGAPCPPYSRAQFVVLRSQLIRAAKVFEADSERETLMLDLEAFLARALEANDRPPLARPDEDDLDNPTGAHYRAVRDFRAANQDRSGHPAERFPVPLFWTTEAGAVELWVPRGALATFLRAQRNWTSPTLVRKLLGSFGWRPREMHPRSKLRGRAHAKVWAIPVPWEECAVDLATVHEAAKTGQPLDVDWSTVHGGPLSNTHARGEASRARKAGTTVDQGTTGRDAWDAPGGRARRGEGSS